LSVKSLHGVSHLLILLPFLLLSNFYVSRHLAHTKEDANQFAKRRCVLLLSLPGAVGPPVGGGWTAP
jgi:hypothetical protein